MLNSSIPPPKIVNGGKVERALHAPPPRLLHSPILIQNPVPNPKPKIEIAKKPLYPPIPFVRPQVGIKYVPKIDMHKTNHLQTYHTLPLKKTPPRPFNLNQP
jgi:hypothetical protein